MVTVTTYMFFKVICVSEFFVSFYRPSRKIINFSYFGSKSVNPFIHSAISSTTNNENLLAPRGINHDKTDQQQL